MNNSSVNLIVRAFLSTFVLAVLPALHAAPELETVLRNMDGAARDFRGMQAQVRWVKYTAIVDEQSAEEGVLAVRRKKDHQADLLIEFQRPYPYYLLVRGTKAEIYRPRIATVEEYDLSKSRDMLQQALLLGFGTSGRFLEENYHVKLQGEEKVAGEATVRVELVPKSEEMLKKIPRLEMWVSKSGWYPVQQKLYEPNSGDYRLYTYTEISLNPRLPDSTFRLKIPRGVKRVFPQR